MHRVARRRLTRRALLAAICIASALAGAWAAPRLTGPALYPTDVADVEIRFALASPSHRGVNLYVPLADWGLRAQVVDAPVQVLAEPRRIDRRGVVALAAGGGDVKPLRRQIDDALADALRRWALLAFAGGVAGGLLALLLWHVLGVRGRALALAPAGGALTAAVTIGGLVGWSALTYDATALERPRYFASGGEIERIVEQADALRRSGQKYSDRVDSAVRSIAGLLGGRAAAPEPAAGVGATTRVVLASDIHNNLLTLPTLRRYGEERLTVLAGDFTVNGGRAEAPIVESMATVGDPVVAVSGNHDSPGIMDTLADGGVEVLDHRDGVSEIGGLSFAGFEDPLAYAEGDFPPGVRAGISFGDISNGGELFDAAVQERWRWWQALDRRPQVLVVHQSALGVQLAERIAAADPDGLPLAILVGHTHRQRIDVFGPVTVVDSGSIGAGGLFGLGTQEVGLALLDFDAAGALEAVELIANNPATSAARAQRVVIATPDCDGELVVCHEAE